ncbi:methyltransferase FkbM family protein [Rubrivivax benzoatilyticus JA2 = ATCC BAA-35]|nr:methyltransferase FkbM family protein [Rubrivivax benzoatilyticus JA2 = ATCC BAA-35]
MRQQIDDLRQIGAKDRSTRAITGTVDHAFALHRPNPLVDDSLSIATNDSLSSEFAMDTPLFARTNYQPSFKPNTRGEYDITEFLALHDRGFVRAAYLAILRREPDPAGAENYVTLLRAGEHKARLLGEFLRSDEGRRHETTIRGLDTHLRVLRLCELPLVGRWIAALLFLANVNGHLRDFRVLENHVIRIAEEAQALQEANLERLRSLSR